jgi:hypothetical protein
LERATQNEVVALCLYWFIKVEIKDAKISPLTQSASNTDVSAPVNTTNASNSMVQNATGGASKITNDDRTNFQIFMDELLDKLRTVYKYKYINV